MDNKSGLDQNSDVFDFVSFKRRMLDDDEIIKKIITSILGRMPTMIDELREYINQEDVENSGRQAHTIKGAAANLNAELFRKSALSIEEAAQSESLNKVRQLLPELETQWEKLLLKLQDVCG